MSVVCAKCAARASRVSSVSRALSPLRKPRIRRAAFSFSAARLADSLSPEQQAQLRDAFRGASSGGPNLGPFPRARLDNTTLSDNERRSIRELGLGGKVARVSTRTGQWLFVALGVGIAGLVVYSTTSELFAKNSPTKLYEQATDKIRQNTEIRSILGERLVFYGDHPSARKRRSHRVQHTLQPDSRSGRQIMTLSFFVESKVDEDTPWHARARTWLRELVWEPSDRGSGPPLTVGTDIANRAPASPVTKEAASPSWWSWLFGSIFSSLSASWRGKLGESRKKKPVRPIKPQLGDYTYGEATATLRQDTSGRFLLHSLTVDVPERGRDCYRIWIVRPQTLIRSKR